MTVTSLTTSPSAFPAQAQDNQDRNGRMAGRPRTFQAPSDSKIADAILVFATVFIAVVLWV